MRDESWMLKEPTKSQLTVIKRNRTILGTKKKTMPKTRGEAATIVGRTYWLIEQKDVINIDCDEADLIILARFIRERRRKMKENNNADFERPA